MGDIISLTLSPAELFSRIDNIVDTFDPDLIPGELLDFYLWYLGEQACLTESMEPSFEDVRSDIPIVVPISRQQFDKLEIQASERNITKIDIIKMAVSSWIAQQKPALADIIPFPTTLN